MTTPLISSVAYFKFGGGLDALFRWTKRNPSPRQDWVDFNVFWIFLVVMLLNTKSL